MKRFSITLFAEKLRQVLWRFPVTLLCVVGVVTLCFNGIDHGGSGIPHCLWAFFAVGIPISMAAALWTEDRLHRRWQGHLLTVVFTGLWGVYCCFLPDYGRLSLSVRLQIGVIALVFSIAVFFISFLKKGKDTACWHFTKETLLQAVLAAAFGLVLFLGLLLALFSIDNLFNVDVRENWYLKLAVICFLLFVPVYCLANIPGGAEKQSEEAVLDKPLRTLCLYILLPVLGVYALILYAYFIRILFRWELPDGWLSTLVSAFTALGLLIILIAYPLRLTKENKLIVFLSRYFVFFALPLLVLMSVGIFRRIHDYGFTIPRTYLLLLNGWFYGITLYMYLTKGKRIKWILMSPALILLTVSVGPWSVFSVTGRMWLNNLETRLTEVHLLENGKMVHMKTLASALPDGNTREEIRAMLYYVEDTYGRECIQPFFPDSTKEHSLHRVLSDLGYNTEISGSEPQRFVREMHHDRIEIAASYRSFLFIDYNFSSRWKAEQKQDYYVENGRLIVSAAGGDSLVIPLKERVVDLIAGEDDSARQREDFMLEGMDYTFHIRRIDGWYYAEKDSLSVEYLRGFLLYR
jgi:hypothetical protein